MNRFALFCTALLFALTAVAFFHDRAHTAPEPAVLPEAAPPPAAVAASAPATPSSPPAPLLSVTALTERIETEVLRPLRGPLDVDRFSRVRRPVRAGVQFRWSDAGTSSAPTRRFHIYENGNPFSRAMRIETLATGEIDRRSGKITLSVGPDEKFVDVEAGLRALGRN